MSFRTQFIVLSAALLTRAMPLAIGFLVATLFTSGDYADTVLLITAANLCGSLPLLAVTPQVIRSESREMAVWLASRGILAGTPVILAAAWMAAHYLGEPSSRIFLAAYASAVFVLGITQSLQNQRMESRSALLHASAISAIALMGGLFGYLAGAAVAQFLNALAVTMLVAGLLSFDSIRRRSSRLGGGFSRPHIASGALDALLSGLFGILLLAGLFAAGLRAKQAGDPAAYVAFTLGLQAFSVVVFVPGSLSSYFVPRLIQSGVAAAPSALALAVRIYTFIAILMFLLALLLAPLLFYYLNQAGEARQWVVFTLIQLAAVLAATNAAYNQLLVGLGRFFALAILSLTWLVVLASLLAVAGSRVEWVAGALVAAYAVLVLISGCVCRHELATMNRLQ